MKLLFDTNILLDLCNDKRAPFHKQGLSLFGVGEWVGGVVVPVG